MNSEDLQNTFMLTHVKLEEDFGTLNDLPYELANAVANIYWRQFEQGHPSSPMIPAEETILREGEYKSMKSAIPDFRKMRQTDTPSWVVDYTVDWLLDVLRHRIPNVDNKYPIWRRCQRLIYPHRDQPNLVRSLKLY